MTNITVPSSIGFILDGNRRWARENNLPQLEGHRRGMEKVKEISSWANDAGIKEVIVYAFSTENWNRDPGEVDYLMKLFEEFCDRWARDIKKRNGRIRFIGQRERFSDSLQKSMNLAEENTKEGTKLTLVVALSYGGRAEIVAAANKLLASGVTDVTEDTFAEALWSNGLAHPDIIIRTGGEKRLSNFLPWQSTYSELFFTDTLWPDFSEAEFSQILVDYAARKRNFGA